MTILSDQTVSVGPTGSSVSYPITASDPENCPITYTLTSNPVYYITFSEAGFLFTPDYTLANGITTSITFDISDGINTVSYGFNLIVKNLHPSPTPIASPQSQILSPSIIAIANTLKNSI